MKFVDEANAESAGRQRRARLRQLPAREVRALRRAGWRRRRPSAAASICAPRRASTRWRTSASSARSRRSPARPGRATTAPGAAARISTSRCPSARSITDAETGEQLGDLVREGRHAAGGARRQGRLGQHAVQVQHQPRAAPVRARAAGREAHARARDESDRGRGAARAAERRQVHADQRGVGGAAEGRGLSVHHAASESGRGRRWASIAAS